MNSHSINNDTLQHHHHHHEHDHCKHKHLRWSAVIAGVSIALSIEVLLNFLGMGIGLISLDTSMNSMAAVGMGSILWLLISGIISMLIAGVIAGKIANSHCKWSSALHGILVWSFATLLSVAVTTTAAGTIIGGPTNIVKSSIVTLGNQSVNATEQSVGNNSGNTASSNETPASSNQAADETTNKAGGASLILFAAFLLSAIAGSLGAIIGRKKEIETNN